jgi:hypothetical protein
MTKLSQETPVQAEAVAQTPLARQVSDRPEGRPRRRVAFGSSKLGVDCSKLHSEGWYCHWVNDYPGRIHEAQAVGYEFVKLSEIESGPTLGAPSADNQNRVSRRVGVTEDGRELLAYLMKIRQEYKNENDAFYQEKADKIDQQIRNGTVSQNGSNDPNSRFYNAGTSMTRTR